MTQAGLKGRCYLELNSVLLEVGYIEKWPKFTYLDSKVPHLKFRVMRDRVYRRTFSFYQPMRQHQWATANYLERNSGSGITNSRSRVTLEPKKKFVKLLVPSQSFATLKSLTFLSYIIAPNIQNSFYLFRRHLFMINENNVLLLYCSLQSRLA